MSSITDFTQEERAQEAAAPGDAKAIVGAFAVLVLVASAWIGFYFGVLQPWLDGAL